MAMARSVVVNAEVTPYYHVISRCVRRAFLCGFDSLTRRNFDHRKSWLVERLYQLSALFAVDICAYGIMSNHFHLVVRIDSKQARSWSEEEVTRRWCSLFPGGRKRLLALSKKDRSRQIEIWRERLYSLSWFMRCLNEAIARRANREDGCTGRFWEGRFRAQALVDEGALLTCMSYVDLNPIRAGIATTLEGSLYTSVRERLLAKKKLEGRAQFKSKRARRTGWAQSRGWLAPFADEASAHREGAVPLPFARDDYIALLRSAAAVLAGQVPGISEAAGNVLARFGLRAAGFIQTLNNFPRTFFTMVGHVQKIRIIGSNRGLRRVKGTGGARRLYISAAA